VVLYFEKLSVFEAPGIQRKLYLPKEKKILLGGTGKYFIYYRQYRITTNVIHSVVFVILIKINKNRIKSLEHNIVYSKLKAAAALRFTCSSVLLNTAF